MRNDVLKLKCKGCERIRGVKTHGMKASSYLVKSPYCRSCGALNAKDKISKGWFKIGQKPWNSGKTGVQESFRKGISNGYINNRGYKCYFRNGKETLEHREVMENKLERKLSSNEVVHHINHKRTDNRLGNLEIMSLSEHTRLHKLKVI